MSIAVGWMGGFEGREGGREVGESSELGGGEMKRK